MGVSSEECANVQREVAEAIAAARSGVLNQSLLALSIVAAICIVTMIALYGLGRGKVANILSVALVILIVAVVVAYFVLHERAPRRTLAPKAKDCKLKDSDKLPQTRHTWEELTVFICAFACIIFTVRLSFTCLSSSTRRRSQHSAIPTRSRSRDVDAVLDTLRVTHDDEAVHEDDACAICLDEWGQGTLSKLRCNHLFHQPCIAKWMSAVHPNYGAHCPVCKADIVPEDDSELKHVFYSSHNTASTPPVDDLADASSRPVVPAATVDPLSTAASTAQGLR